MIVSARAFDFDEGRLLEAYPWLSGEALDSARRYYEAFADEIDLRIEENLRTAGDLEVELETLGS